ISVQLPYNPQPVSDRTEPLYTLQDGVVRYAAGSGFNILMFKYPLEGDYTFTHSSQHGFRGESHNYFGGAAYVVQPGGATATARGLIYRGDAQLGSIPVTLYEENTQTLNLKDDRIMMSVNGHDVASHRRSLAAPFVGVVFEH